MEPCKYCKGRDKESYYEPIPEIIEDEKFDMKFTGKIDLKSEDCEINGEAKVCETVGVSSWIEDGEIRVSVSTDWDVDGKDEFWKEIGKKISYCPMCGRKLK